MIKQLKVLGKKILPASVLRKIRQHGNPVVEADIKAAWKFKREFFWYAFKALDFNGIDGDYVEFGSYSGMTFRLAFDQLSQRKIKRHMWSFDSFHGLPDSESSQDNHPGWKKSAMAMNVEEFHRICHSHDISKNDYSVVQGFYGETLAKMRADTAPTNIALAYIDCDMYSSTKTVLEFLAPRLKHGMIVAFDDYFCWSAEHLSGEKNAFADAFGGSKKWNWERYRDISWGGASFVVEYADLASTSTVKNDPA